MTRYIQLLLLDGIKLYTPQVAGGYSDHIGHMPCSVKSIARSVTDLIDHHNNLPDFSEGYTKWRPAWEGGKGGYWTEDLKEAIIGMDSAMRQNQ